MARCFGLAGRNHRDAINNVFGKWVQFVEVTAPSSAPSDRSGNAARNGTIKQCRKFGSVRQFQSEPTARQHPVSLTFCLCPCPRHEVIPVVINVDVGPAEE